MTTSQITSGQKKQLKRFAEDAIDSVLENFSDKDVVQRVIEKGDQYQDGIAKAVEMLIKKLGELPFASEEVKSSYGYLSGYKPVEDLDRQIEVIQKLFPGIGGANPEYLAKVKDGKVPLPNGAEKFFAVINWQKFPEIFGKTYNDVAIKCLDVFKNVHGDKFVNYRDGELGPKYLRQSKKSIAFWQKIIEEQGNADILIVPAQFGIRHRGRSVRRALVVMGADECGLGLFATTIMLLTHPERLKHYDDLYIDIAGDEYSPLCLWPLWFCVGLRPVVILGLEILHLIDVLYLGSLFFYIFNMCRSFLFTLCPSQCLIMPMYDWSD